MNTLLELRISVSSTNKVLKGKTQTMNPIELLRNAHPLYRSDFASRLFQEKIITKEESKEFVRFGSYASN